MEQSIITYDMPLEEIESALYKMTFEKKLPGNVSSFRLSGYEMMATREYLGGFRGEVAMPTLYTPPDEVYTTGGRLMPESYRAANIVELMLYGASNRQHGWYPIVALGGPTSDCPPEICPEGWDGVLTNWAYNRYPRHMIGRGHRMAVVPE